MNELLKKRIERRLESLSDDMGYRVLDYVEFLESKYGSRAGQVSPLQKIADSMEDAMRVGGVPVAAIKGTMQVVDAAGKVMDGISAAGKTVVSEIQKAAEGAKVEGSPAQAEGTDGGASSGSDTDQGSGAEGRNEGR